MRKSVPFSSMFICIRLHPQAAATPMTNDSSIPPPPAPRTVSNHPGDETGTTTTGYSRDTHLNTRRHIDSIRVRLSNSLSVSTMPCNKERIRRMQSVFNRERNKHKKHYERWRESGPGEYHQHSQRDDWCWKTNTSFGGQRNNYREAPRSNPNPSYSLSHHYAMLGLNRCRVVCTQLAIARSILDLPSIVLHQIEKRVILSVILSRRNSN